jgi:hypothetical protein
MIDREGTFDQWREEHGTADWGADMMKYHRSPEHKARIHRLALRQMAKDAKNKHDEYPHEVAYLLAFCNEFGKALRDLREADRWGYYNASPEARRFTVRRLRALSVDIADFLARMEAK